MFFKVGFISVNSSVIKGCSHVQCYFPHPNPFHARQILRNKCVTVIKMHVQCVIPPLIWKSNWKLNYRTCAIISRGLYIFYPISKDHLFTMTFVSISSCQRNLMKTYHNEANSSGITKIASKFSLKFFKQSR